MISKVILIRTALLAGLACCLFESRGRCVCETDPARGQSRQQTEAGRVDVEWLNEIQQPPERDAGGSNRLTPWSSKPLDRAEWQRQRRRLRREWLEFLGPLASQPRPAPKFEVLESELMDGVQRQRIEYASVSGELVEAYLLVPAVASQEAETRLPAVVVFHSTVAYSIRQPAGLEGPSEKHFGIKLAEQGFVVICPRNYLWPTNDKIQAQQQADRHHELHPRSKGMARMLFDGQLAVDLLCSLPNVDSKRISAIGHSLGAKEVLYLAALDDRVIAAVSSEGGIGIKFSNWDADWYLGPQVRRDEFVLSHHQLLAMVAPRPFLLVGGDSADGDRSWPYIDAALPVYRLYSQRPPLGLLNHRQGHAVPAEAEARMLEWIAVYGRAVPHSAAGNRSKID